MDKLIGFVVVAAIAIWLIGAIFSFIGRVASSMFYGGLSFFGFITNGFGRFWDATVFKVNGFYSLPESASHPAISWLIIGTILGLIISPILASRWLKVEKSQFSDAPKAILFKPIYILSAFNIAALIATLIAILFVN